MSPTDYSLFDVVVIGGGAAGCATAIALQKTAPSLRVGIAERQPVLAFENEVDSENTKPWPRIGETLPASTVVQLQQLGLWESFKACDFLPAHGSCSAWGSDLAHHNEFILSPYGNGWHLDRNVFDRWMLEEAEKTGVTVLTGYQLKSHRKSDDTWHLSFKSNNEQSSSNKLNIESGFVVDATGRNVTFACQQGAQKKPVDQLVGIYRFFDRIQETNSSVEKKSLEIKKLDTSTLVESHEHGWWYSALLPNKRMVVTLMTDADIARKYRYRQVEAWQQCLEQCPLTANRHKLAGTVVSPLKTMAAHTQCLDVMAGEAWLAVGDAAMTYDPLSSLGIFKALRMGIYASFAIADYFKGIDGELKKYQGVARSEYQSYLQKRQEYYCEEQRFKESVFWQRRHQLESAIVG